MRLQVASELHHELAAPNTAMYRPFQLADAAVDALILAGDIHQQLNGIDLYPSTARFMLAAQATENLVLGRPLSFFQARREHIVRYVLFLDFDGVLHRGDSYITSSGVVSSAPGAIELFEYTRVLVDLLSPYPQVEVVFSSDWAFRFGMDYTKKMLPVQSLRDRVTGATYQGCVFDEFLWPMLSRGAQVLDYVRRHSLDCWLAVDDRRDGFEACRDRLIHCHSECGLGDRAVVELLQRRLHQYFS